MFRMMIVLLAMLASMLAATPASAAAPSSGDGTTLAQGRELSQWFLQGDTASLWQRMSPQMREALGSAAALAQFRKQVGQQLGEETVVLDESVIHHDGNPVYLRTSQWTAAPGPILMQWALDAEGAVTGFFVRPKPQAAPSPHLDYQTRAPLQLPFNGQWYVFWGGHDIAQNYHAAHPGQRFAYDFVQRIDGSSHQGDGSELTDYYCWNEPILAPAAGTVIAVVDTLPDQAIGTTNTQSPAGNHVMLDFDHDEYALFAHLQQGSVTVVPGDRVEPGQVLGRCGNSGNTSEPHLHFHLQDAPVFGEGLGLPAFFNHYIADGQPVLRGEPVRGQTIQPAVSP